MDRLGRVRAAGRRPCRSRRRAWLRRRAPRRRPVGGSVTPSPSVRRSAMPSCLRPSGTALAASRPNRKLDSVVAGVELEAGDAFGAEHGGVAGVVVDRQPQVEADAARGPGRRRAWPRATAGSRRPPASRAGPSGRGGGASQLEGRRPDPHRAGRQQDDDAARASSSSTSRATWSMSGSSPAASKKPSQSFGRRSRKCWRPAASDERAVEVDEHRRARRRGSSRQARASTRQWSVLRRRSRRPGA